MADEFEIDDTGLQTWEEIVGERRDDPDYQKLLAKAQEEMDAELARYAAEKEPAEWLEGDGDPIIVGPDDVLTHPGDPEYDAAVKALVEERRVEHLRRFPPAVRREAIRRLEEIRDRLDEE